MIKSNYLFIIICLILVGSCRNSIQYKMPDYYELENLVLNNPDSLAALLENQINPFALTEGERMNYVFWLTWAHFRQDRSLVNDTLIQQALEYYKTHEPEKYLVTSYMLAADQIDWSGKQPRDRIKLYEEGLEAAEVYQYKDTFNLKLSIKKLSRLYEIPADSAQLKNLVSLSKKYMQGDKDLFAIENLIDVFNKLGETDSILKYGKEGLELAAYYNSDWSDYKISRTCIEALNKAGRYKEALKALRELEKRVEVGNELKLNYISTWIGMNQLDSARIYIERNQPMIEAYKGHEEIDVMEIILKAYQLVIDSKEGKSVDLSVMGFAGDNLLEKSRKRISADRERQYIQNKLVNDNLRVDIERGKIKQGFLWSGIVVLIMICIIVFYYQRRMLQHKLFIQQMKEHIHLNAIQLSENEAIIHRNEEMIQTFSFELDESEDLKETIDQLSGENETLKRENESLQEEIKEYSSMMDGKDNDLMAFERLVQQNSRLQERERFLVSRLIGHTDVLSKLSLKPKYIDEMQWPEIYQAINQLFDGFTYRLHTDFPSLTEEDIRYCCLIKLHLSNSVISTLTGISPSSVTKRKHRIKEKMSQQHRPDEIRQDQSLEIYLWNY